MNRMMCLLLVLWPMVSSASPIEDGHQQFAAGQLRAAVSTWEAALQPGPGSAVLHHNLGAGWYRLGDKPRAIAHWRTARLLSPRDANLVHNLAVVRSELPDVPAPVRTQPATLQLATVTEWGVVGGFVLGLSSLGLWLPALRRRLGPWPPLGGALVGVVLVGISVSGGAQLSQSPGAVVRGQGAFLRSLATRQSEVIAQFPGGTELVVEARHAGFVLVRAGSQMRGWLPEDGVFVIGEPLGEPAMN